MLDKIPSREMRPASADAELFNGNAAAGLLRITGYESDGGVGLQPRGGTDHKNVSGESKCQ